MSPKFFSFAVSIVTLSTLSTVACNGSDKGDASEQGTTKQELKKKTNGQPSGDGKTCSWDGVEPQGGAVGSSANAEGYDFGASYEVGTTFKSPDQCNDCACSNLGIVCTLRACDQPTPPPGKVCPAIAILCPDGAPSEIGPNCELVCTGGKTPIKNPPAPDCEDPSGAAHTSGTVCDVAVPPSEGSETPGGDPSVGSDDPGAQDSTVICAQDAKKCSDGSYVTRTGPKCAFAKCPAVKPVKKK